MFPEHVANPISVVCDVILTLDFHINRVSKQRLREAKIQAADYLILLLAEACLGSITKPSDQTFGAAGYAHSIIAVCE
ncbi:hypothetical protein D5086_015724 [Populus alba]|uniref:Uncharacterized protein n=1 Tax=Populus alba TaxID=43335 RepID=A0ACC4BTB2_POPAL